MKLPLDAGSDWSYLKNSTDSRNISACILSYKNNLVFSSKGSSIEQGLDMNWWDILFILELSVQDFNILRNIALSDNCNHHNLSPISNLEGSDILSMCYGAWEKAWEQSQ